MEPSTFNEVSNSTSQNWDGLVNCKYFIGFNTQIGHEKGKLMGIQCGLSKIFMNMHAYKSNYNYHIFFKKTNQN